MSTYCVRFVVDGGKREVKKLYCLVITHLWLKCLQRFCKISRVENTWLAFVHLKSAAINLYKYFIVTSKRLPDMEVFGELSAIKVLDSNASYS